MISDDVIDVMKMMLDKPIEEYPIDELRQKYEDLLNVMIGIIVGSSLSTERMKKLIKEVTSQKS